MQKFSSATRSRSGLIGMSTKGHRIKQCNLSGKTDKRKMAGMTTKKGSAAGGGRELPAAFVEEMGVLFENLPGVSVAELPAFFESLRGERSFGLRRNPLKYGREEFEKSMPFSLKPIPWAEEGYFYEALEQPGKSSCHEAGAFYVQEPSAMIAAELLGAGPGEYILDLCAAPGGKSTQIAGKMRGEGLLVCNEYVPARAEVLSQNIERMGITNCVILSESPEKIAARFSLFFDRVLVDAPCSGEGMFRKEEQALLQWSPENVTMCAKRQREILWEAAKCVKPGGVLVYSTCTFSEAEDEMVVQAFLEEHREFQADDTVLSEELERAGVCPGGIPGTVRMWPHKLRGEGHFAARLVKAGGLEETFAEGMADRRRVSEKKGRTDTRRLESVRGGEKSSGQEAQKDFQDFSGRYLREEYLDKLERSGTLVWRKERLFLLPKDLPDINGLRAERVGLYLGEAKKGRFEPSHTWAMTMRREDVRQSVEAQDVSAYLRGETLHNEGYNGWLLVLAQGKPIGWGKAGGNTVKNHYPKGLRISH